jgi:membrane protease YdiL (CAAX protease family)
MLACRRSGWRVADYLALTWPRAAWLRLAAPAFAVPLAVSIAAAYVAPASSADEPKSIVDVALMLIGIIVIAPIAEELVFRGFLYRALAESRLGAVVAVAVVGAAFAHGSISMSEGVRLAMHGWWFIWKIALVLLAGCVLLVRRMRGALRPAASDACVGANRKGEGAPRI